MNETTTVPAATAAPDRAAIRAGIESTRAAYREVVQKMDDAKWKAPSENPGWTCGQLAWHVSSSVNYVNGIIENAKKGKETNLPGPLNPLAFRINGVLVRIRSRRATRESVLAEYDAAAEQLLKTLDATADSEFAISATNYGLTKTMLEMFETPREHFTEHAPSLRS